MLSIKFSEKNKKLPD